MKDMITWDEARSIERDTRTVTAVRFWRTAESGNFMYKARARGVSVTIIVPPSSPFASMLAKVEAMGPKEYASVSGATKVEAYPNDKGEPRGALVFTVVDDVRVVEPRKDVTDVSALRAIAAKQRWSESDKVALVRGLKNDAHVAAVLRGDREVVRAALA